MSGPSRRGGHALSSEQVSTLLGAVTAVGHGIRLEPLLRRVVSCATELVDARYGAMGVLDPDRPGLADFVFVGLDGQEAEQIGAAPDGHGLLGHLLTHSQPIRLSGIATDPDAGVFPPHHPVMSSFLGVPVRARGDVFGNLYMTDKRSGGDFTDEDEELALALAAVAGVAIENWQLHIRVSGNARIEERERVARDLHDTVVQRIFSIGLALQGAAAAVDDVWVAAQIERAALDLGETVDEIRTTVLDIQTGSPARRAVRRELTELIAELAEREGVSVSLRFEGAIDTTIGPDPFGTLVEHLFASAHGALLALHRDEGATRAEVLVSVGPLLTLTVRSDRHDRSAKNSDASEEDPASWIEALDQRARTLGGNAAVHFDPEGCEVVWTVPLFRDPA